MTIAVPKAANNATIIAIIETKVSVIEVHQSSLCAGRLPLWGCAQSDNRAAPPDQGQRLVVTTRSEYMSAGQVASRLKDLSGVPVREVMDVGPSAYRVTLGCADPAACRAAAQRIADDRSFSLAVEIEEGRQKIPVKPTRESAR